MIRLLFSSLACILLTACQPASDAPEFDTAQSPYFQVNDHLINIEGVALRYRDEGDQAAPAIVMVHGFTSSLETWDALSAELISDYRIIRLDLPGHGLTGPDPQARYTNDETVDILAGFMRALNLENPALLGNSLGGLLSWRYAYKHPSKLKKLILISPGGFSINGVGENPVDVPLMVKFYLTTAPEAGVSQALQALYGDPEKVPEGRMQTFRDMMQVPGNGDAFVQRAAEFTLPAPEKDLSGVSNPTLILWGEKDVMVSVEHADKFQAVMPDAKVIKYEGVGHIPQEEIPLRVAADIRVFLDQDNP